MEIIPAIDIKGGKCVRLYQGDYKQETIYSEDPVAIALKWQAQGATSLHIIDLDGAASGESRNMSVIEAIVKQVNLRVQLGGGIRDKATVKRLLDAGINRTILGTVAIGKPDLVKTLCQEFGEAIMVSIDARDGYVATHGWKTSTSVTALDLGLRMVDAGVKRILYTDINRDGTLTEPDFKTIAELIKNLNLPVIAAGGIAKLNHLKKLEELGAEGAIVGKAIYTGDINLKEALTI